MRASCFGRQLDLSSLRHLVAKLGEIQRSLGVFAEGPLLRSRFEAKRAVEKPAEEGSFGGRVRLGLASGVQGVCYISAAIWE